MSAPIPPGLRRQLAAVAVIVAIAFGSAAAVAVALREAPAGRSASRAAADRSCAADDRPAPTRWPGAPLAVRRIAEVDAPATAAFHPDGSGDGVLGERGGRILRISAGEVTDEVLVDLRSDTLARTDGGLLALEYDPAGEWLYAYRTRASLDDEITAFRLDEAGRPVGGTARRILHLERHSRQHHGGGLLFGPDGSLYIGTGDGGGIGDPGENAQDPRSLLGKVLRIEPTPGGERPYRVRADNPFVGEVDHAPEIWALGVRNPFRMSLDAVTGDIWLGDVGQSCWEELDRLPTRGAGAAGANLGWDRFEGTEPYEAGELPGDHHAPEHTYGHAGGRCAVVAGHVVRGVALAPLEGWLLFGDYCNGNLLGLRAESRADSSAPEGDVVDLGVRVESPVAIVEGPAGLPWVLSLEGGIYELDLR